MMNRNLSSQKWRISLFVIIGLALQVQQLYAADAYCFKFTWLGPTYDNDSISEDIDRSCSELKLAQPCIEPLVITYDGTPPNTTYMWEHINREDIACKLTRNEVCIKWVNYYNGLIENITYTCGKMTIDNKKSVEDDCQVEKKGAYMTRVCACRTPTINDFSLEPCNAAATSIAIWISLFATAATLVPIMWNRIEV